MFAVVYQGKIWNLNDNVEELDLRSESRIHLVESPNIPWPRGPNVVHSWGWEGQDAHFVMTRLGKLLEDHAAPFERTIGGLQQASALLTIPIEEWTG